MAEGKVVKEKRMNSVLTCSILGPHVKLQVELLGRCQEKIVSIVV